MGLVCAASNYAYDMKYYEAYELCEIKYYPGELGYRLKKDMTFYRYVLKLLETDTKENVLKKLKTCEHS